MAQIADRATRLGRAHGISVAQMAQRSKIDESDLEAILRGERDLKIQTVFRLAAALDVTPATLLRGIEWIPDASGGGHFKIEESSGD